MWATNIKNFIVGLGNNVRQKVIDDLADFAARLFDKLPPSDLVIMHLGLYWERAGHVETGRSVFNKLGGHSVFSGRQES